ncbi:WD40 repeat-like protein [Rhodofomes roseus]|uniref:WD repeat-containing protein JIP5 n=1 Tax=Rhodofomes roseus TaxID=34475 RepID=A0ABQ8KBY9_9APHY|nr:WD40 repeat-like protein [Rhodofomes roseus]KAH9834979.1 WD40 repeat-like protein [Rhodofomes roseus]
MPDIHVGTQIFDLIFHPSSSVVYLGLLTGHIKAFGYDDEGEHDRKFSVRPSKRSCRALAIAADGGRLWAAGKAKAVFSIDTGTGQIVDTWSNAHDTAINRVKSLTPNLLASGDDDGVIKLWDLRKSDSIRTYTHHFDFISDFLWLEDSKQLVSTSGDGTLSVIDVRSKKTEPIAQSEDQEDELLSIVPIKGGQKFAVGTQLGILSIFNRRSGWGDCVDRIPGHPHSIDTLAPLPAAYAPSQTTFLTGSSDGLLRAVQLFPTKLLGVVADHGEFPIERIAVDRGGEGRWVGSAGHEEVLKLTDLQEVFADDEEEDVSEGEEKEKVSQKDSEEGDSDAEVESSEEEIVPGLPPASPRKEPAPEAEAEPAADALAAGADSSDDEGIVEKKRKRKKENDPLKAEKRSKGRNTVVAEPSFFADL